MEKTFISEEDIRFKHDIYSSQSGRVQRIGEMVLGGRGRFRGWYATVDSSVSTPTALGPFESRMDAAHAVEQHLFQGRVAA
jgi:hypothetical protein